MCKGKALTLFTSFYKLLGSHFWFVDWFLLKCFIDTSDLLPLSPIIYIFIYITEHCEHTCLKTPGQTTDSGINQQKHTGSGSSVRNVSSNILTPENVFRNETFYKKNGIRSQPTANQLTIISTFLSLYSRFVWENKLLWCWSPCATLWRWEWQHYWKKILGAIF